MSLPPGRKRISRARLSHAKHRSGCLVEQLLQMIEQFLEGAEAS